jgi:hypothetical protein
MWVCTNGLEDGLNLLRHYLDGLDKQDALLLMDSQRCGDAKQQVKDLQDHFKPKNNKARYDYNTIVISLYGYLERFIEDLIAEYLALIASQVPSFSKLPTSIQNNHLELSLDLVRKADYQRNAGSVRVQDIVARLHSCFTTPNKYQLNDQAYAQHTANFRQSVVVDTLNKCGITDIGLGLRQSEPLIDFLRQEDPERDMQAYMAASDDIVFARLNDLANRRNDVAHGNLADEILSRELLRTYIGFIEAYARGLALVVYERSLPFLLERSLTLGAAIAVYDHRIVCVNLPAGTISVGDTLIAKTQDTSRPYKAGAIKEIEQNNTQLTTIDGGPDVKVGLLVEFGAKDNQDFYVLSKTPQTQGDVAL